MGDGIIAKFIYFWIFLLGGLFAARFFGIADTTGNMIVLSISLALIYVGWCFLRAKSKAKTAARAVKSSSGTNSRHKKRKNK